MEKKIELLTREITDYKDQMQLYDNTFVGKYQVSKRTSLKSLC